MTRRDLIFRVFVSSTFRDLIAERNALQERVFPNLRKYCQEHGARFQAIDLRWGVSQEAALDQQTMNICSQELARCQEMSPRPNFIILLGERYGWRPLPERIPAVEFESLWKNLQTGIPSLVSGNCEPPTWSPGNTPCREGWYRKDCNAVPEEYVLQPRAISFPENISKSDKKDLLDEENKDWRRIEIEIREWLLKAIDAVGWTPDDPRRAKYEQSATHQEIVHGALDSKLDSDKHTFSYFRTITGAPGGGSVSGFIDTGADAACLNVLKTQIKARLPKKNVHEYQVGWARIDERNQPEAPEINIEQEPDLLYLCDSVEKDLKRIIDDELRAFKGRPELEREMEAHREFGKDRSRHFIGQKGALDRIGRYLNDQDDNRPLIVHGISGSGKTALMAQAWFTLSDSKQSVARFIGATPASAELRTLLRSLCQQLGIGAPPSEMNELVRAFRSRLAGPESGEGNAVKPLPAVLFLDALDQLNPSDNARMLYWLPRTLAPGVKLVISVLQGQESSPEDQRDDPFSITKPESLAEVGQLGPEEGKLLLETWLKEDGRTLQEGQINDILPKFERDGRPLYLKVAFEESRLWRSWDGLPCGADAVPGLNEGIEGILVDMLDRLERPRHHGRILVERALGHIAATKNGLTEDELLDVLSRDNEVTNDYLERNPESPKIDRIPVVIWSRLYADLKPYMTQRRADGTIVMNFYHRQVGEAVQKRYLVSEENRVRAHLRLAEYFDTLDFWAESLEAQQARAKRLPPTPRPANVRKVVELPYHRLEVAKLAGKDDPKSPHWDAIADLLTDWQFLEAKVEADPNILGVPPALPGRQQKFDI